MSILVVCPGCKKSFKVSDKFAGKSGACPKCKAIIHVPGKGEEVRVHGPAVSAGERSVRPILREQSKLLEPVTITVIVATSLGVLVMTWILGKAGLISGSGTFGDVLCTVGLLAISPPLVVAAYCFLRNDELEPYQGVALWIRATACGVGYVILWGIFGYVHGNWITGDLWEWMFVAPPLLAVGALIPLACLELEYGNGFFHYCFYVLVTGILRWVAGLGWIWEK